MRPAAVASVLGQLSAVLAGLTLVPVAVAAAVGDWTFSGRCLATVGILAGLAIAARRLPRPKGLQANEALVASVAVFLLAPLVMTYPMAGAGLAPLDGFFEALSAVTTTGLSMATDLDAHGDAFVFTRAWMQWYGGLGFVVLSVALVVRPGKLARQLAASDGDEVGTLGSARAHGRAILGVYAVLTIVGLGIALASGVGVFSAAVHVLSSVSTGGFSSRPDSLATIGGWPTQLALLVICCAGAVPLAAYVRGWREGWGNVFRDLQLRALLVAIVVLAGAMVAVLVWVDGMEAGGALRHGTFQVLSAQSTTGFSTLPVVELSDAAKLILIVAMFVGGGAGSTAGGIKLLRAMVVFQVIRGIVEAASLPRHAVVKAHLGGNVIEEDEARQILSLVVLFAAVIVLSWLAFVVAGFAPLDALFEVVSATGTVGLSTGITDATLPAGLKLVLCADMLLGRLEVVAVLVALHSRTWRGRRREW